MACDQCLGLLIISVVCFIIGGYLIKDYSERKKIYSIWLSLFYFIAGAAWLFKLLLLDWLLKIYSLYEGIYLIVQLIPFLFLMIILLDFLLVEWYYWIIIPIATGILALIHFFIPLDLVLVYVQIGFIGGDILLLGKKWLKYKNHRDLGIILGLATLIVAQIFLFYSEMWYGIILTITSFIWGVNYTIVTKKIE